jgi:hypothetical protein
VGDESSSAETLRAIFVRRAIETNAPLLAPALHQHAHLHGLSWTELASSIGCTEDGLNRLACCGPPRQDQPESDLLLLAEASGADRDKLRQLLVDLGLVGAATN